MPEAQVVRQLGPEEAFPIPVVPKGQPIVVTTGTQPHSQNVLLNLRAPLKPRANRQAGIGQAAPQSVVRSNPNAKPAVEACEGDALSMQLKTPLQQNGRKRAEPQSIQGVIESRSLACKNVKQVGDVGV